MVGLAAIGAGIGIGKIGGSALEGVARQPEAASKVQNDDVDRCGIRRGGCTFRCCCIFLRYKLRRSGLIRKRNSPMRLAKGNFLIKLSVKNKRDIKWIYLIPALV